MKRILSLTLAASLAACATVPASPTEALTRAQASFERIQLAARWVLPMLPIERRAQAQVILNRIAVALALARAAADPQARDEAIGAIVSDLAAFATATRR